MTNSSELCFKPIGEIKDLLRTKMLSPTELTEAYLDRIEAHDPHLNAFITVTAEQARKQATEATAEITNGRYRSPLHGIPLAYKDIVDVAGVPTTCGSQVLGSQPQPAVLERSNIWGRPASSASANST